MYELSLPLLCKNSALRVNKFSAEGVQASNLEGMQSFKNK